MEAQVTANLQAEDKGERFSVVNAASAPVDPIRPKRFQLLMTGLFGGLAIGFALVTFWEFMAGPIHGEGTVTRLMGMPPLAVIPILRPGLGIPLLQRVRRYLRRSSDQSNSHQSGA
jgi:capsular polysaccharide biosynthesis protein